MKKSTKIWLVTATLLIIAGIILFVGVMMNNKWDFLKLSTDDSQTVEHTFSESFDNISIDVATSVVKIYPSSDGVCKVKCKESEKVKHDVKVENNTLYVKLTDERKWYEHIGIHLFSYEVSVFLPETQYKELKIKDDTGLIEIANELTFDIIDVHTSTGGINNYASAKETIKLKSSTGSITVDSISAKDIDLSVTTGKIVAKSIKCDGNIKVNVSTGKTSLTDVECGTLYSDGNTGGIDLKNVIASGIMNIERSTGSVNFEKCDASELFIETDTGDVKGSLLSEKVFITETDTGSVKVPKSVNGGRCEISTDTGDIIITIEQ